GFHTNLTTFNLLNDGKLLRRRMLNFRHEKCSPYGKQVLLFHLSTVWGAYQSGLFCWWTVFLC
ncbi:hypothetical protein, partial [Paenibacillus lactis]|uniref:hypothetical protein n=1 Tax=Paenibacillus lactis TaxID=228574 RepID=UPI0036612ECA